jgi:hypothetical protein
MSYPLLLRVASTIAGALICAIIGIVVGVLRNWPLLRGDPSGFAGLGLIVVLSGPAIVSAALGAIGGFLTAAAYGGGHLRAAWSIAGVTASLAIVASLGWLWMLEHPRPFVPADASRREAWARRQKDRLEERGRTFAHVMQLTIRAPRSGSLEETLDREWRMQKAGLPGDERAALRGYTSADDGWRWEVASESPPRVVIVPDPLFGIEGPVFEIEASRTLRMERRGALGAEVR